MIAAGDDSEVTRRCHSATSALGTEYSDGNIRHPDRMAYRIGHKPA